MAETNASLPGGAGVMAEDEGRRLEIKKWAGWFATTVVWIVPLIWIDPTTYFTLTVAGLTMGMLLFLTASGLTLIFGLMDVLNLAHGAFFAWGAYAGYTVMNAMSRAGWVDVADLSRNLGTILLVLAAAVAMGAILGFILERIIIRGVYGDHLKQILVTMGVSLVAVEIIKIIWGPNNEVMLVPASFYGTFDVHNVMIDKFRVLIIFIGGAVFAGILLVLKKTKLGIIVRAGVENREIVQAMGYNIHRVFTGVFTAGAALAAMGGAMFCIFKQAIHPGMGDETLVFALIIVIIGGLGSVTGSFIGAIMVGLAFNYVYFLIPKLALGVNILIMAIILLLRPTGLLGRD
ncbi:MAG: branched-chain amino acid ABC transporter permease [Pseudomonadota bacterium]